MAGLYDNPDVMRAIAKTKGLEYVDPAEVSSRPIYVEPEPAAPEPPVTPQTEAPVVYDEPKYETAPVESPVASEPVMSEPPAANLSEQKPAETPPPEPMGPPAPPAPRQVTQVPVMAQPVAPAGIARDQVSEPAPVRAEVPQAVEQTRVAPTQARDTGHRQTAHAPATAAAPAPAAPAPVGQNVINPNISYRGAMREVNAADNQQLQNADAQAAAHEQSGKTTAAIAEKASQDFGDSIARQRENATRTQEVGEDYRKRMDNELSEMKSKMGKPPFDTVGLVFGLVSALAAAKGKQGVANAMQAVGQAVNTRMKRWQGEIEGNKEAYEGMGRLANLNTLQGKSQAEQEQLILKAQAAEMDLAFEEAKRQTTNADEIAKINHAQIEYRKNAYQAIANAHAQRAQNAAEARAWQATMQGRDYGERMKIAERFGPRFLDKYRKSSLATDEQVGKITGAADRTASEVALNIARKNKLEGNGQNSLGYDSGGLPFGWRPRPGITLTEGQKNKFHDMSTGISNVQSMLTDYEALGRKLQAMGLSGRFGATEEARRLINNMRAIKGNIPNPWTQALGGGSAQEQEAVRAAANLPDVDAFFQIADPMRAVNDTIVQTQRRYENAVNQYGERLSDAERAAVNLRAQQMRQGGQQPQSPSYADDPLVAVDTQTSDGGKKKSWLRRSKAEQFVNANSDSAAFSPDQSPDQE